MLIDSLEISNFRCFESAKLTDLQRINLIVGKNASGKTALLEALFVATGLSPEIALRVKAWRGMTAMSLGTARGVYEELWRDLFHRLDQTKLIHVTLRAGEQTVRTLRIGYAPQADLIPIEVVRDAKDASTSLPISFTWTDHSGHSLTVQPEVRGTTLAGKHIQQSPTPVVTLPAAFLSAGANPSQEETAEYFSSLSRIHEEGEITSFITTEFPFVEQLSVESFARTPTVFASVRGVKEKLPINLLSSGLTKVVSILLSIASQRGGILIIDELENGLYWNRLPAVWSALLKFATIYDVQLFVTSHSRECIEAAASAAKSEEAQFSLMRVERTNGSSKVHQFTGKSFRASIEMDADVR